MKPLSFFVLFFVAVLFAGCSSNTPKKANRLKASTTHNKKLPVEYVSDCFLTRSPTITMKKGRETLSFFNCRSDEKLDFVIVSTPTKIEPYSVLDTPETAKKYYSDEIRYQQLAITPKKCEPSGKLQIPELKFDKDKFPYLVHCGERIVIENRFLWRDDPKAKEFQRMFNEERRRL